MLLKAKKVDPRAKEMHSDPTYREHLMAKLGASKEECSDSSALPLPILRFMFMFIMFMSTGESHS